MERVNNRMLKTIWILRVISKQSVHDLDRFCQW